MIVSAPVAPWCKSLAAGRLACVAATLRRSGFNPRLLRLVVHAGPLSAYSEINISDRHTESVCILLRL